MEEKLDYQAVMEIVKIMLQKELALIPNEFWSEELALQVSNSISKIGMRMIIGNTHHSSFFDPISLPHSHIADHSNHNYFSPSCKKCNHVMDNHVKYGNTDWYYCKTCLRYKKKSDCV